LAPTRRTEAATYFIAALCLAGVLRERALDFDFVGREDRVNRAIAGEVLAVLAPADSGCDGFGGDLESDLAAQAATKVFVHGMGCSRSVAM
jgi:hypothetical protein